MKLSVLSGFREYLFPNVLDREALLQIVRAVDARAIVPDVRWSEAAEDSSYHTFLYDEPEESSRALPTSDALVELFLEFLEDTSPVDASPFVVLPFDTFADYRATKAVDTRVCHFIRAARTRFGTDAVQLLRLHLSDNTQAVLHHLLALRDGHADAASHGPPTGLTAVSLQTDNYTIIPLRLDQVVGLANAPEKLSRNYSRAVLQLGHDIVAEESLFAGSGHAALVADLFDHNQLHIRPDVDPQRVAEELLAGGKLFELLSSPLSALIDRQPETADDIISELDDAPESKSTG